MKNLFLYKVYQYNKKLFYFFLFFIAFTLLCNFKGFEITPFYVWGMYSGKESQPREYTVFKITANDKMIDYSTGYFAANRYFLLSPLAYYESIKIPGDPMIEFFRRKLKDHNAEIQSYSLRLINSREAINQFPDWYKKYLEQTTGEKINHLQVEVLKVSWLNNVSIKIDSVYTLIDEK